MATTLKITILVDDRAAGDLMAEHGLSFWIEVGATTILFDTGQGPALAANARALGIDLARTDLVVLSHGHYDHTGGLPWVLARARRARVHGHPGVWVDRYSIRDGRSRAIGLPGPAREALRDLPPWRCAEERHGVRWSGDIGLSGEVPRRSAFEDTGGPFFLDPAGHRPDPLLDDQAMWVRTREGLVVITGCSHAGLINTLAQVTTMVGESRVRAIIGGFHLGQASPQRLAATVAALREWPGVQLVPCHCTGAEAMAELRCAFGAQVTPGEAGQIFTW